MRRIGLKIEKSSSFMKKSVKNQYDHQTIESIWQSKWENEGIYHPDLDSAKSPSFAKASAGKPFYNLMMFPYPSAEGLHIGGVRTFSGVDIYGRFMRMKGYDVFQPFGLDGFGIHAENYALKIGAHPMTHAKITEKNYYRQIRESAIGVDWGRTAETYKKDYYKWTQWLFTELFKEGLATRKKSPVNFCPSCKTVLADEQVIDGKCERCSSVVEKKNLEQWFFRITKYADRLLANIDKLNWTEKVKIAQRNWIGKKDGISIKYQVLSSEYEVEVFTTRPDTNFGATFIALAPEHPFVALLLSSKFKVPSSKLREIENYIKIVKKKSEIDRQAEGREKTGVFTGLYALNPLTGYEMPVWIADFVLMGFGTGAVVGVPGHDKRDFEFAKKFGLEIIRVVVGRDGDKSEINKAEQVQEEEGKMINSGFLNGMDIHKATQKIMDYMEEKGYGKRMATYHLRDWLISRQRYWGPPIPMVYCPKCAEEGKSWFDTEEAKSHHRKISNIKSQISNKKEIRNWKLEIGNSSEAMAGWYPAENLPVELPYIEDFKPLGTGKSPLGNHPEFYEVKCPHCGSEARRETDVSDTFLDSAWYFFRYISTEFDNVPFDKERAKKWLPVTMYIGGAEHSVLHLLYARFITMFLKDRGLISFEEPFSRFYAHGMIIKDGAKMSKSKGNVVGPDMYIKKYGADTLRTYLHFLGPFDQTGDFKDEGIDGMNRFLKRVWTLFQESRIKNQESRISEEGLRIMHQTIKNVTGEMEELRFNTAIAYLMTWYNFLAKQKEVNSEEAENYLKMLAPFAPHMTEELYQRIKNQESRIKTNASFKSIHTNFWPEFDEKYLVSDIIKIPVQVNGKLRGTLEVAAADAADQAKIEELAREDENVSKFLEGQKIKKAIYIKGKVLNFVI
jgi:leucyl-tRNA synthetase